MVPTAKKVSAMNYYAYRIMFRSTYNFLHRFRQLFNQFLVDMYAKIETERLLFIRLNQQQLRVDEYIHLQDSIENDGNVSNMGQLTILPSSYTGGPRYMQERTQDAMTYVRNYGRPDLFITFTCNSHWPDIANSLLPGQSSSDRHDIVARVFKQKLVKLMSLITKGQCFGETRCYMYSVEWQKRGLPHAHILLWLKEKLRPQRIDSIISAEFPDPDLDSGLHNIVKKTMVHGPCGALNRNSPCMRDGKCSKRFPRQLLLETQTGEDGYWVSFVSP